MESQAGILISIFIFLFFFEFLLVQAYPTLCPKFSSIYLNETIGESATTEPTANPTGFWSFLWDNIKIFYESITNMNCTIPIYAIQLVIMVPCISTLIYILLRLVRGGG
jgi:hypothetical protein